MYRKAHVYVDVLELRALWLNYYRVLRATLKQKGKYTIKFNLYIPTFMVSLEKRLNIAIKCTKKTNPLIITLNRNLSFASSALELDEQIIVE